MNQNELDKIIDQGLERLAKKALIQADIRSKAIEAENAIIVWLLVYVSSGGYIIYAWRSIEESGHYSAVGIVSISVAVIMFMISLYQCVIYRLNKINA